MRKLNSTFYIITAMILGIITGVLFKEKAVMFAPIGNLFLKLIKMLVVPLIFFNIISGAAALGKTKSAGKMGLYTLLYYLVTSVLSVIIGIEAGKIFKPGIGVIIPDSLLVDGNNYSEFSKVAGFWETVENIISDNPFNALTSGNILQILIFSLFFGIALSTLSSEKQRPLLEVLDTINETLIKMVEKILLFAPFGVFGLISSSIALFGVELLGLLLKFFVVFTLALSLIHFIMLPGLVTLFTGMGMIKFIKTFLPAQILAFSTASSLATLPVSKECCSKVDVDNSTSAFVLPLGATINMNGNAMLYGLMAAFFAQMFNVEIGIAQYVAIVISSVLGAVGTAGVPGPSLLVVAVLASANIPLVGLPLIFGVDRILDMMRTSTNILGDASCAVIMDKIIKKR